jgi:pilus assembly protein Flp/PilA
MFMLAYLRKVMRRDEERGASAVEYGLMVAAIAAVIVGVVFALGTTVRQKFEQTSNCIQAGAAAGDQGQLPCPEAPAVP